MTSRKNVKPLPAKLAGALAKSALGPHRRTCWVPRLADGDGGPRDPKLGGLAFVPAGERWPTCPSCAQPLALALQLDLDRLPEGAAFGGGLLQVFYCNSFAPNCQVETEAWAAGPGRSKLVRVIPVVGEPAVATAPELPQPLAARRIVGFDARDDYPCYAEASDRLEVDWDAWQEMLERAGLDEDGYGERVLLHGDKLGGWPTWAQDPDYPRCAICDERMKRLVFQLRTVDGLDFVGDGWAYVVQCVEHPEQVELIAQA